MVGINTLLMLNKIQKSSFVNTNKITITNTEFNNYLKNNNKDLTAAKIIGENENVVRIMTIHKSKGLEGKDMHILLTSSNKL